MRFSPTLAVIAGALLAVPGSAAANGTAETSKKVVGANASVSSCGSLAGMDVSWTSTNGVVTALAVNSIPSACIGATLSLTLVDASNASLGVIASTTITGTSQSFSTVTGSPSASSVDHAYVSVIGP